MNKIKQNPWDNNIFTTLPQSLHERTIGGPNKLQ